MTIHRHRMPFGAEPQDDGAVRFRLWAPGAQGVALLIERPAAGSGSSASDLRIPMEPAGEGWFERITREAPPGSLYRYAIDRGDGSEAPAVPDPASRFQPRDVHGPSEVIDPAAFDWQDDGWTGRPWEETVLYELHVGTFTPEGTFRGVMERLDYLKDLGVTAVELMPVADFPGTRNWGYDGVLPYAPDASYGRPEDLKALVQAAHARGLMVFLDVVYNHFGPEGNYLHLYAPQFFTERHQTPWGAGLNFDGPGSRAVRDFFIHNALYWLEEYRFDGLRLDAVHAIADDSDPHILAELGDAVRARFTDDPRRVHPVLENDANQARWLERRPDGTPRRYAAQWNDDCHHALHVIATGETDGYYADYATAPARHLGRCLAEGFAYQGDPSAFRDGEPRGEPSAALPPTAFVNLLQNHDQVGNRAFGERIGALASPEALRAVTAVLLLAPSPPLLFMGQELMAETPFQFFADFGPELARAVTEGRRREFASFERFADPRSREAIPDPEDPATFHRSKLDWDDCHGRLHRLWHRFHRELLETRRQRVVPRLAGIRGGAAEYALAGDGPAEGSEAAYHGLGSDAGRTAAPAAEAPGRAAPAAAAILGPTPLPHDPRGLRVRWRLGDGSGLVLTANLGPVEIDVPESWRSPPGEVIHLEPPGAGRSLREGRLPPWSVAWHLEPAGERNAPEDPA